MGDNFQDGVFFTGFQSVTEFLLKLIRVPKSQGFPHFGLELILIAILHDCLHDAIGRRLGIEGNHFQGQFQIVITVKFPDKCQELFVLRERV